MIPLFKPGYDDTEILAMSEVLQSRWTGMGSVVERFETLFADYIGVKYAVAVNSCTSALNLAVKCLVPRWSNVATTPISFVSTASAIVENSCKPIFCEVDHHTLNLDIDKISDNVMGVIPVHYGGRICDMDKLMWLARKKNIAVIEDAAHACGSTQDGKKAGSFGDCGCFSFHAVKNLSCGDGGMITTDDKALYERLRKLRWCGIDKSTFDRDRVGWEYEIEEIGFKYHMNDITAAMGIVQLEKLDSLNQKRKAIADRYSDGFSLGHHAIAPIVKAPIPDSAYSQSSWHIYQIQTKNRDALYQQLKENGITAGVHYKPIYKFKAYKQYKQNLPVTETVWPQLLSLPMYPEMTVSEQDMVIGLVKDAS